MGRLKLESKTIITPELLPLLNWLDNKKLRIQSPDKLFLKYVLMTEKEWIIQRLLQLPPIPNILAFLAALKPQKSI